MIRKSRFGSKAGRDTSRDGEEVDSDGSTSVSDDSQNVVAEEVVDRYERSSDRYRAGTGQRAGAEKSASARRSFGGGFIKADDKSDGKDDGTSRTGLGSNADVKQSKKSSFGRGGSNSSFGANSLSRSRKADAAESSDEDGTQQGAEPVYERSSDRVFPKRQSSFGNGLSKSARSDQAPASGEAHYERSSDRKFGSGKTAGRKAADSSLGSSLRGSKSSPTPSGDDVFERSSERTTRRRSSRPAQPVQPSQPVENASKQITPTGLSATLAPDDRIERARAALQQAQALVHSKDQPRATVVANQPVSAIPDADPFEPFEPCVPGPSKAIAADPVYSRGSAGRTKADSSSASNDPNDPKDAKRKRPPLSLRGRALGYLSRREHSRDELSRKLTRHLTEGDSLETLLDALEQEGWLSNERFAESVVHRRGSRLGTSRIVHELKRNGIDETLILDAGAALKKTELTRAQDVWRKKFDAPPATPAERAKHARFLATRGFNSATIMKVLKAGDDDFIEE
jgi:SOS response regulatory protein OraA/RecX